MLSTKVYLFLVKTKTKNDHHHLRYFIPRHTDKTDKGGKGDNQKLEYQHTIPDDHRGHKFIKKSNKPAVFGRQMKSSNKPSEFGYMFCPHCSSQGYKRNDRFEFFHDEFMYLFFFQRQFS